MANLIKAYEGLNSGVIDWKCTDCGLQFMHWQYEGRPEHECNGTKVEALDSFECDKVKAVIED